MGFYDFERFGARNVARQDFGVVVDPIGLEPVEKSGKHISRRLLSLEDLVACQCQLEPYAGTPTCVIAEVDSINDVYVVPEGLKWECCGPIA